MTYTNVSSRPLAGGSVLGALFAGGRLQGDFEAGAGGLGYPGANPFAERQSQCRLLRHHHARHSTVGQSYRYRCAGGDYQ